MLSVRTMIALAAGYAAGYLVGSGALRPAQALARTAPPAPAGSVAEPPHGGVEARQGITVAPTPPQGRRA